VRIWEDKLIAPLTRRKKDGTPYVRPARAVFDAGVIYLNQTETAIEFTDVGYFFVKDAPTRRRWSP
jgi:hypothetical protein